VSVDLPGCQEEDSCYGAVCHYVTSLTREQA
jgi:hypothetical protein